MHLSLLCGVPAKVYPSKPPLDINRLKGASGQWPFDSTWGSPYKEENAVWRRVVGKTRNQTPDDWQVRTFDLSIGRA
jgi:hypothetical protein